MKCNEDRVQNDERLVQNLKDKYIKKTEVTVEGLQTTTFRVDR